jgi:hypothetical protein
MNILEKIDALRDSKAPVNGMVDAERAAVLLDVPAKRFSTWHAKRTKILRDGELPAGVLAAVPNPVGYLNGGAVWRASDIEKMRPAIAGSVGSVGRPRKAAPPESQAG